MLRRPELAWRNPGFVGLETENATHEDVGNCFELRDLAANLLEAQEEERRRVARELHDELGQRLALLEIQIEQMKRDKKPVHERKPLLIENRNILRALQETPSSLRNRILDLKKVYSEYQRAKRGLSEGNLRLVVSIPSDMRSIALRPSIPLKCLATVS